MWFCLQYGLSVCLLWGVMFANSFVSLLVGGYVCYWVCLFVGLWPCHNIIFFPLGMVSVFRYRIKAIPWILNYKWADYWPYWEFIYLFFSMWPSFVMCITMGYLFHVWGRVGVGLFFCFVISICTELLCFERGI